MSVVAVEDLSVLIANALIIPVIVVTALPTATTTSVPRELLKLPLFVPVLIVVVVLLVAPIVLFLLLLEESEATLEGIFRRIYPLLIHISRQTWFGVVMTRRTSIRHFPVILLEVSLHLIRLHWVQILPIALVHDPLEALLVLSTQVVWILQLPILVVDFMRVVQSRRFLWPVIVPALAVPQVVWRWWWTTTSWRIIATVLVVAVVRRLLPTL